MRKLSLLFIALLGLSLSFAQRAGTDRDGGVDVDELYGDLMEISSGGVFRGVSFDMSKSKVLDVENARSTTSVYRDEGNELVITTDMGPEILNFADVTYTFDSKGLYHIKVESYAIEKASADEVFNKVKSYFTNKLGSPKLADDDYYEFYGKNGKYDYTVAIYNLDYEESPGMYMYIYVSDGFDFADVGQRMEIDRYGNVNIDDQFDQLMELSSGGVFRGASFDMSKSAVKEMETARNTTSVYKDEEDKELVITTDMGADILNFADVTYTFDEQGLYHIGVESYAVSKAGADRVFNKVKSHFTSKLGTPTLADDGFYEFYGKNGKYSYVVAIYNLEYEDSPGMEMYIYITD